MLSSSGPLDPRPEGLTPAVPGSAAEAAAAPSLRRNSLARLMADLLGIGFALVAATVAARLLGPAGKGYYSSLILLGGLFIQIFGAGLGEAAIVLSGQGRYSLATAIAGTMASVIPLSLLGGLVFCVTSAAVLRGSEPDWERAVLLAGMLVVLNTWFSTVVSFLVARERVVAVAALTTAANGSATVALWVLVAAFDLGVDGAVLGSVVGAVIGLAATLAVLHRASLSLRPAIVREYQRAAFRLGVALQVSNLLVLLTARLDLLLVYRLSGASEAGGYSVALTIGALVGSAPIAVSYASFPRLAALDQEPGRLLTLEVFRVGMAAAVSAGAILALASPFVIPLAFGEDFRPAIAPALILIPGGALWSGQWLLCRAAAARGAPRALLVSFALSFLAMVALDIALIDPFGAIGAAVAAGVAPALGLLVALAYYRKAGWDLAGFLLRPSDFRDFVTMARQMLTQGRPAQERP